MPNIAGKSGTTYVFDQYPLDYTAFGGVHAVYIYTRPRNFSEEVYAGIEGLLYATYGDHPYCYIGETQELEKRMQTHLCDGGDDHYKCAIKNGASHLLVHFPPKPFIATGVILTEKDRVQAIETDLLDAYNTPCNKKNN